MRKEINTSVLSFPEHLLPKPTLSKRIRTLEDKFGTVEIIDSSTLKAGETRFPVGLIIEIKDGLAQWYIRGLVSDNIPVGEPIKTQLKSIVIKGKTIWTPNNEYFNQLVSLKEELECLEERIDDLTGGIW